MSFDAAKELLAGLPMNQTLGVTFDEVGLGTATAKLANKPELHNHVGTLHAGALFTLAEGASGAALLSGFADLMGEMTPLAKEATIRYRKIAKGAVTAKAKVVQPLDDVRKALAAAEKGVEVDVRVVLTDEFGTDATEVDVKWFLKKNR